MLINVSLGDKVIINGDAFHVTAIMPSEKFLVLESVDGGECDMECVDDKEA